MLFLARIIDGITAGNLPVAQAYIADVTEPQNRAKAFGLIGSYSLIAFVTCAFVTMLIVLCFAEVSSRFTDTGGPYRYAQVAFGPTVGFQVGWLNWLARISAYATNCNLLVVYLSFFWPPAASGLFRALVITLLTVTLTLVNYLGVRNARAQSLKHNFDRIIATQYLVFASLLASKVEEAVRTTNA
jgi:amino acid transporter